MKKRVFLINLVILTILVITIILSLQNNQNSEVKDNVDNTNILPEENKWNREIEFSFSPVECPSYNRP